MEVLLSEKNPLLKQVRRAVQKGALTDDGFAIAEGFHLLEEALKSQAEINTVIVSQSLKGAIQSHVKGLKLRVVVVRDADFPSLASTAYAHPLWSPKYAAQRDPMRPRLIDVRTPASASKVQ